MSNWFTDFFSAGTAKVIDSVGSIVDNLHTSDDEKNAAKLAVQKEVNAFKIAQLTSMAQYDKEITERHKADMTSDSWLSKNIRPLIVAFLTVSTVLLAYLTIFILNPEKSTLLVPWIDLLTALLVTAYSFYFGSRGFEKIQKIKQKAQ